MMKRTLRSTFFAGLIFCLPLVVTFWLMQLVFTRVDQSLTPWVLKAGDILGLGELLHENWAVCLTPIISMALGLAMIFLVGLVGGNVLGRQLLAAMEQLMLQVPVVRSIYGATRQFIGAFSSASGKAFSRVVLVQYPRPGAWTMGFVTNTHNPMVSAQVGEPLVCVFMPTTPNPTSGWLVFVPDNELKSLSMSVDDAFKLVVSGGVLGAAETSQPPH